VTEEEQKAYYRGKIAARVEMMDALVDVLNKYYMSTQVKNDIFHIALTSGDIREMNKITPFATESQPSEK
jgi:hypothetical protein